MGFWSVPSRHLGFNLRAEEKTKVIVWRLSVKDIRDVDLVVFTKLFPVVHEGEFVRPDKLVAVGTAGWLGFEFAFATAYGHGGSEPTLRHFEGCFATRSANKRVLHPGLVS